MIAKNNFVSISGPHRVLDDLFVLDFGQTTMIHGQGHTHGIFVVEGSYPR